MVSEEAVHKLQNITSSWNCVDFAIDLTMNRPWSVSDKETNHQFKIWNSRSSVPRGNHRANRSTFTMHSCRYGSSPDNLSDPGYAPSGELQINAGDNGRNFREGVKIPWVLSFPWIIITNVHANPSSKAGGFFLIQRRGEGGGALNGLKNNQLMAKVRRWLYWILSEGSRQVVVSRCEDGHLIYPDILQHNSSENRNF